MWVNVWYYLGNQLIVLAAAFGLSLCFESPFIRLEKLWIGALLQAIMPSQSGHAKKNGKVHEQKTVKILDEIIERLDREEEENQQQSKHKNETNPIDSSLNDTHPEEEEKEKEHYKEKDHSEEEDFSETREKRKEPSKGQLDQTVGTTALDQPEYPESKGFEALAVAEVHVQSEFPPTYDEIAEK